MRKSPKHHDQEQSVIMNRNMSIIIVVEEGNHAVNKRRGRSDAQDEDCNDHQK